MSHCMQHSEADFAEKASGEQLKGPGAKTTLKECCFYGK